MYTINCILQLTDRSVWTGLFWTIYLIELALKLAIAIQWKLHYRLHSSSFTQIKMLRAISLHSVMQSVCEAQIWVCFLGSSQATTEVNVGVLEFICDKRKGLSTGCCICSLCWAPASVLMVVNYLHCVSCLASVPAPHANAIRADHGK